MELFDQFISHIFNKKFDWEREAVQPLLASAHLWYAVGFAYLPLAFGIREQSELFKPIRPLIKLAWGVWNLGLAVFSAMGSRFTAGAYLSTLQHFSNTCDVASSPPGIMSGLAQRWTYYFIVSKMLELGDTLFLGALGKPIGFLHWWHHIAMFTFCYFNGVFWHPHLISGVFWNYSIHAVMYSYYAAQCVGIRWPYPQLITALQIIQMFAQITAVVASIVVCKGNYVGHYAALVMFTVFIVLFSNFFLEKYFSIKEKVIKESKDGGKGKKKR